MSTIAKQKYTVHLYSMDMIMKPEVPLPPVLFEMDHDPDIFDHLEHDGSTYVVCMRDPQRKCVGVQKIVIKKYSTQNKDSMICPWCGYHERDAWEYSRDEDEVSCGSCGLEFRYTRDDDGDYTTVRVKRKDGETA